VLRVAAFTGNGAGGGDGPTPPDKLHPTAGLGLATTRPRSWPSSFGVALESLRGAAAHAVSSRDVERCQRQPLSVPRVIGEASSSYATWPPLRLAG